MKYAKQHQTICYPCGGLCLRGWWLWIMTRQSSGWRRAAELLSLLPQHPLEFCDRINTIVDVSLERRFHAPDYRAVDSREALRMLKECVGTDLAPLLEEPALFEVEHEIRARIADIPDTAPFPRVHNGTSSLGRLCYAVCRVARPSVVVETGVAFGVTTAFILKALEQNGHGALHSVDKAPFGEGAAAYVGLLVPLGLRERWTLHRGTSRQVFPRLLPALGRLDVFLHDSRHTYRNICLELDTVTPYLKDGATVIADDIERSAAFRDWSRRAGVKFWTAIQETEKRSLTGFAVIEKKRVAEGLPA